MVGHLSGSDKQPYQGEFHLSEEVYSSMKERAAERPKTEVGGMLFGEFEKEDGEVTDIRVERVVNVPDDKGVHQATYFSIHDNFMSRVVDEYIPPYTYLGNWHSHLGYGGPSSGDHKQVTKFFEENPTRNHLIAVIQDRAGGIREPNYNTYIELYERKHEGSIDYRIHNVDEVETIEHPPKRSADHEENEGADKRNLQDRIEEDLTKLDIDENLSSDLYDLVSQLANEVDHVNKEGIGTAYQNPGNEPEIILLVPIELELKTQDTQPESKIGQAVDEVSRSLPLAPTSPTENSQVRESFSAFLSISIPGNYPDGDIYVDIKSRDQTVQATFTQSSSAELSASPQEFCRQIQTMLENEIDEFLAQSVGQLLAIKGGRE